VDKWTITELKCRYLKILTPTLLADRVFDRGIIPHTPVSKHRQIYDDTLLQQVYLQHGGGYFQSAHQGDRTSYHRLSRLSYESVL